MYHLNIEKKICAVTVCHLWVEVTIGQKTAYDLWASSIYCAVKSAAQTQDAAVWFRWFTHHHSPSYTHTHTLMNKVSHSLLNTHKEPLISVYTHVGLCFYDLETAHSPRWTGTKHYPAVWHVAGSRQVTTVCAAAKTHEWTATRQSCNRATDGVDTQREQEIKGKVAEFYIP